MAQPFVGEIRIFAGNFNPAGWMFCEGQLLPISENETLFNLIGTTYGGDGQSTFALPDLRGRLPLHQGTGPGLGTYTLAESGGVEEVTLNVQQIPAHPHTLMCTNGAATDPNPQNDLLAENIAISPYQSQPGSIPMAPNSIGSVGGSQPHTNFQPYLCLNFIISLFGIFPSQT
jgi:microcystin-dependent protein